jgi:hypothetical protein
MQFLRFPADDHLWVVKWYDKHRQMHELSRSASVEVLLQRLPGLDAKSVRGMSQVDVGQLLAKDKDSPPVFRTELLDASSLPAIRIGHVYQSGRRVGDLPSTTLTLNMPGGEGLMKEVLLGDNLEKPAGWADKYNFRLLNPSQYELPFRAYDGSRCIVRRVRHKGTDLDIVIPRTLIEQSFYYPDSYMVNVAGKGDWDAQKDALIVFRKLDNGLETAICRETGTWKVVVRTHVLKMHAPMMAFFAHSPYAQESANLIHTLALKERGLNRFAPWHASGRIPWDPELGPFRMKLRGFLLKGNRMKGSETFLATHIAGWTLPERTPDIEDERENSGHESTNGTQDPGRSRGGRSERRGNSQHQIQSGVDADPNKGFQGFDTSAIEWLEEPRVRTQTKSSHISPTGEPKSGSDDGDESSQGSTGPNSGQTNNPGKVTVRSIVHPGAASFARIEKALKDLEEEKFITSFTIFGPVDASQRQERGEASCWNFLPNELRKGESRSGRLPTRGWFIVDPRVRPRPRAALVLRIVMGEHILYWTEIELRSSEAGMRSPILANIHDSLADSIIDGMLRNISEKEGRNLASIARYAVADQPPPANATLFQHAYVYEHQPTVSAPSAASDVADKAASASVSTEPCATAAKHTKRASKKGKGKVITGLNLGAVKRVLLRAAGVGEA